MKGFNCSRAGSNLVGERHDIPDAVYPEHERDQPVDSQRDTGRRWMASGQGAEKRFIEGGDHTTELTPELVVEGHARDLVRQVQQLRKDAGLAVSDRVVTYLGDVLPVRSVLEGFGDYVRSETLTEDLRVVPAEQWDEVVGGLSRVVFGLDGQEVNLALETTREAASL